VIFNNIAPIKVDSPRIQEVNCDSDNLGTVILGTDLAVSMRLPLDDIFPIEIRYFYHYHPGLSTEHGIFYQR
jgi:hypothetical protein